MSVFLQLITIGIQPAVAITSISLLVSSLLLFSFVSQSRLTPVTTSLKQPHLSAAAYVYSSKRFPAYIARAFLFFAGGLLCELYKAVFLQTFYYMVMTRKVIIIDSIGSCYGVFSVDRFMGIYYSWVIHKLIPLRSILTCELPQPFKYFLIGVVYCVSDKIANMYVDELVKAHPDKNISAVDIIVEGDSLKIRMMHELDKTA